MEVVNRSLSKTLVEILHQNAWEFKTILGGIFMII
jgi:hypothetical protein